MRDPIRTLHRTTLLAAWPLLVAGACSGGGGSEPEPRPASCTFTNPLGTGQDPWIVRQGGQYYFIESSGQGIWVYKSASLTTPKQNGVLVWTPPPNAWNSTNVWAPELHFVDGKWFIYYAAGASGPPFIHQRAGVLESQGTDPQGGYLDRGMLYTGDSIGTPTGNRWAIDLTVHRIGGELYAAWSGWEGGPAPEPTPDRVTQHTYMARMSDPKTIATNRVKLSSPVESWEDGVELDLHEGQTFLERGGTLFLVYSTRESWLPAYRLGQLRFTDLADPMNPAKVVKNGPVFEGTSSVYGAGHASYTKSPDGTEDWIMYHSKVSTAPGWSRDIRAQKFTWNADGSPDFGTPIAAGTQQQKPSGECSR